MKILLLLLILMTLAGLWTVITPLLIRAAIALALTSALLSIIMFQLGAALAAVFELSVCAGLISVIFVSVISLTTRQSFNEYVARRKNRFRRFWPLPVVILIAGIVLCLLKTPVNIVLPPPPAVSDVRIILWDLRRLDLLGQIMILLAGVYGVLVLFKGGK
jgi:NADH-quinone oxidoreductase subunit J